MNIKFSILLFGSTVIITVCSINMHKMLLVTKGRRKVVLNTPEDLNNENDIGDLIIHGSNNHSQQWRLFRSVDGDEEQECTVEVFNNLEMLIVMCWVDEEGILHHFHVINDNSIKDGSVANKHCEGTQVGHCFVWFKFSTATYKNIADISDEDFIAVYRPKLGNSRHKMTFLTDSKNKINVEVNCVAKSEREPPIDTSGKEYVETVICGFPVKYEPDLFDCCPEFRAVFETDLAEVLKLLPSRACALLQSDTCFWLNKSLSYGPANNPIKGQGMCFHPRNGQGWLKMMGMHLEKAGGVELYDPWDYVRTRGHWGEGGVLLHELCHAYHNKHCPDGFDCEEIREAYTHAMSQKLYDKVHVHGPQGKKGPIKAYACANCMEFWAELSVAFLYEGNREYNKWFPFNRKQLLKHDPATYCTLKKYWRIEDEDCETVSRWDVMEALERILSYVEASGANKSWRELSSI